MHNKYLNTRVNFSTVKQFNRWRCSGSERRGVEAKEVDIRHDVAESR